MPDTCLDIEDVMESYITKEPALFTLERVPESKIISEYTSWVLLTA